MQGERLHLSTKRKFPSNFSADWRREEMKLGIAWNCILANTHSHVSILTCQLDLFFQGGWGRICL